MNWWSWLSGLWAGILAMLLQFNRLTFLEFVGAVIIVSLILAVAETIWEELLTV